ncbi:tigger transposable element-derived protein 1-like [Macrobrachium nipponense]|uniref:tigger transposable element-derived protein 1-like n=1 Tax=Macrobrachium nipponense TaxID=159736 RepID=UPI0030C7A383
MQCKNTIQTNKYYKQVIKGAERDSCGHQAEDLENQEFITTYAEVIALICEYNNLSNELVATSSDVHAGIDALLGLRKDCKMTTTLPSSDHLDFVLSQVNSLASHGDSSLRSSSGKEAELGNGHDGYLSSEEIYIKEEPIEPMEEPSNREGMAPKHKVDSADGSASNRKSIPLDLKLEVLMRLEKGESHRNIARAVGIPCSTVSGILENKKRILEKVKRASPMTAAIAMKQCIFEVERLLLIWLEDQNQRRIPVSLGAIEEKARRLHQALKSERGEGSSSEQFVVSKDLFNRFKTLAKLPNLKVPDEAARADEEAVIKSFPTGLAEIIREGGYLPQQVFNVDETGLFWKRLPSRTSISKEEKSAPGHKVSRERLTLLLGGNASGDLKLKPLLVYLAENPRAFKGILKSQLPVIWKSNQKAWVTLCIFEDWFTNHFVPTVKEYCIQKNLPFKALLVLDNAPGHPSQLDYMHPNVKVVYFPPNTASILQPVDQGVMASFKAYYLQRMMNNAFEAIGRNKELTFKEFWKSYNILEAVKNIAGAWDEVQQTSMNGAWKRLCPQFVNDFIGFEEFKTLELQSVTNKIIGISKELHLEIDAEDVNELLESHGEELSEEDLIQLEKQVIEEEEEAPVPDPLSLSDKGLSEAFFHIEKAMALFEAVDPDMERYTKILGEVMDGLTFYRVILEKEENKKRQTYIRKHFPTPFAIPKLSLSPNSVTFPPFGSGDKTANVMVNDQSSLVGEYGQAYRQVL